MKPVVDI
jgi:hypothetical protein